MVDFGNLGEFKSSTGVDMWKGCYNGSRNLFKEEKIIIFFIVEKDRTSYLFKEGKIIIFFIVEQDRTSYFPIN